MMLVGVLGPAAVIRPRASLMFMALLGAAHLLQRRRFISAEVAVDMPVQTNPTPRIPGRPDAPRRAPTG